MKPQLAKIAEDLGNGRPVQPVTTREFLSWFDARRRGYWIVRSIRRELEGAGLQTVPDFESAYIDAPIELRRVLPSKLQPETSQSARAVAAHISSIETSDSATITGFVSKDPTYRISKLPAANQIVVSVKPDGSLAECVTIMLSRDFSQLPVMTNDRDVKGVISWRSIGSRLSLSNSASHARDFMEPHHEIRASASMFEAIPTIVAHEYVLIRSDDSRITGIITATDLSQQFLMLAEPFLLLGEIENLLRTMIDERFTPSEFAAARDPADSNRKVESAADLTFGEYTRLLQNPDRWQQFGLAIDRVTFCRDLDAVREIRNNVVHFDPEGILEEELKKLRTFTSFLRHLQSLAPG
jgi:predicted transcriptional regulator